MVMVSGNSTVLCFQTKIVLEKQKTLFKPFIVTIILFRMLNSGETFEIGNSKITIKYSKSLVKEQKKKKRTLLENKLKEL